MPRMLGGSLDTGWTDTVTQAHDATGNITAIQRTHAARLGPRPRGWGQVFDSRSFERFFGVGSAVGCELSPETARGRLAESVSCPAFGYRMLEPSEDPTLLPSRPSSLLRARPQGSGIRLCGLATRNR